MISIIELCLDASAVAGRDHQTIDDEDEYLIFETSADRVGFMPPVGFYIGLKKGIAETTDGECDAYILYRLEPAGNDSGPPDAAPSGPKN